MSLSRRVALMLAACVLLALVASLTVQAGVARAALQAELQQRSHASAQLLARVLSAQEGDVDRMRSWVQVQVDLGLAGQIVLLGADGAVLLESRAAEAAAQVPDWFARLMALDPATGRADLLQAGRVSGHLRLEPRAAWALEALWRSLRLTAAGLLGLALLAAVWGAWLVRRWQQSLREVFAQAEALEQGHWVEAEEPRLPELGRLTRSLNATVRRLREVFAAQAEQVKVLQRQALLDGVTGLALRGQFTGRLQAQLAGSGGPGVALILVRVLDLEAVNQRMGHEATDRLLVDAASLLQAYVDGVPGTFAGRLNGADFALCLPAAGLAAETAASLHAALVAAPALHAGDSNFPSYLCSFLKFARHFSTASYGGSACPSCSIR